MVELRVPKLEMDLAEVTVLGWLVEEGAAVHKGDPVVEVETDKTSFELEAPADGVLRERRAVDGESVAVGSVLACVATDGEDRAAEPGPAAKPGPVAAAPEVAAARVAAPPAVAVPPVATPDGARAATARPAASPAARRAAAERALDLAAVPGSGPNGRVYRADVLAQAARPAREAADSLALTRDLRVTRLRELAGRGLPGGAGVTELVLLAVARVSARYPTLAGDGMGRLAVATLGAGDLATASVADAGRVPLARLAEALDAREDGGGFPVLLAGDVADAAELETGAPAALGLGAMRTVPRMQDGEWVPDDVVAARLRVDRAHAGEAARFLDDLQEAAWEWERVLVLGVAPGGATG